MEILRKTKKTVLWAIGIFLIICVTGMSFVVFNLNVRDVVRTHVLSVTKKTQAFFLGSNKSMPILAYHGVEPDYSWGLKEYFVSPQEFENQMKYLKDNGYTTITAKQLDTFKSFDKPVLLTFDDAYEDLYDYAYPILKKYEMKASLFVVSDFVGKKRYLNASQIKEMMDVFEVDSHTKSHPNLKKSDKEKVNYEMSQSKADLEKLTGKSIEVIAYPFSNFNKTDVEMASLYYKFGLMNWGGRYYGFEDKYKIPRIPIHWDDNLNTFIKKITE